MILPFRNNPFHLKTCSGFFTFVPEGKPKHVSLGKRRNPIVERYKQSPEEKVLVARFFVGLSVGGVNTYSMDHVVTLTRAFLREHGAPEDSSFIAQRGVYTYEKGERRGQVVEENSVQIALINTKLPEPVFTAEDGLPVRLAEHLCAKLRQETIIVEIQRNGVTKYVWSVSA